ncbi:MAG: hypothetical protein WAN65_20080 [Candidatus Sulfotelmatobacter sp.]
MGKEALEGLTAALDNWAAVFTLLVVVGVGGELVVHVMQSRANKKLIALQHTEALAQESEIARMKKDSASFELDIARANRGAAESIEQAANAEKQAAESNRKAEEERVARLKLEATLKPRRLTANQKARLSSILRPFAPVSIFIEWPGSADQEVVDLASDFNDAIVSAGIPVPLGNRKILMGESFRGLYLKTGNTRRTEAEVIAQFLIDADLAVRPVTLRPASNPEELTIGIGAKPVK